MLYSYPHYILHSLGSCVLITHSQQEKYICNITSNGKKWKSTQFNYVLICIFLFFIFLHSQVNT